MSGGCDGGLSRKRADRMRAKAKAQYESEGSIEIDESAPISKALDPGCYVQAWVWVYYKD